MKNAIAEAIKAAFITKIHSPMGNEIDYNVADGLRDLTNVLEDGLGSIARQLDELGIGALDIVR